MEVFWKSFRKAVFSKKATARLARPVRRFSEVLFQSKWSVYATWCRQRQTDPHLASLPTLADFFIYLRDDEKLKLSTIKGYRAALAAVFTVNGTNNSSSHEISALFKSFAQGVPAIDSTTPKWDLSVVLQCLNLTPFEPLSKADVKFVTLKTVFLVALASDK